MLFTELKNMHAFKSYGRLKFSGFDQILSIHKQMSKINYSQYTNMPIKLLGAVIGSIFIQSSPNFIFRFSFTFWIRNHKKGWNIYKKHEVRHNTQFKGHIGVTEIFKQLPNLYFSTNCWETLYLELVIPCIRIDKKLWIGGVNSRNRWSVTLHITLNYLKSRFY